MIFEAAVGGYFVRSAMIRQSLRDLLCAAQMTASWPWLDPAIHPFCEMSF
jgi:hypothetical protein